MTETLFALAEVAIFVGGLVVALLIAPHLETESRLLRLSLITVFLTGGSIVLVLAMNTAFEIRGLTVAELTSWEMGVLVGGLLIGLWGFIFGIYWSTRTLDRGSSAGTKTRG